MGPLWGSGSNTWGEGRVSGDARPFAFEAKDESRKPERRIHERKTDAGLSFVSSSSGLS